MLIALHRHKQQQQTKRTLNCMPICQLSNFQIDITTEQHLYGKSTQSFSQLETWFDNNFIMSSSAAHPTSTTWFSSLVFSPSKYSSVYLSTWLDFPLLHSILMHELANRLWHSVPCLPATQSLTLYWYYFPAMFEVFMHTYLSVYLLTFSTNVVLTSTH